MKQCLITGGGSKFGAAITQQLIAQHWHVHLVTSNPSDWIDNPQISVLPVNWHQLEIASIRTLIPAVNHLDLIFFNHNASALNQDKFKKHNVQNIQHWQNSYFVACQFPFYLIHSLARHITPNTRIGWMLSELITNPRPDQVGYADYIGNKFTNACIMKSFSQFFPACFFGIHPDGGLIDHIGFDKKSQDIVKLITEKTTEELNGNIFSTQGEILKLYEKI